MPPRVKPRTPSAPPSDGPSSPRLSISARAARRFLLERFALREPQSLPAVAEAVTRLEYVQMDSIEICARVHDLILWSRVRHYTPADLTRYLYEARQGFEYYAPNLSILPVQDLAYYHAVMRRWATGRDGYFALHTDQDKTVASWLLEQIEARGALHPREVADQGRTVNGWGTESRLTTHLLEKLYAHGRLGIAFRTRFDRHYDLLERLYPLPAPMDEAQAAAYRALKQARAWRIFKPGKLIKAGLDPTQLIPLEIEGISSGYMALREDLPLLEQAESLPIGERVQLLAPLEPLIYDRDRTRLLFQFDYTWEVYTPQPKRKWGYYVLPILLGERLIGRLDAKLDRKSRTLLAQSLSLEPGVAPESVAQALAEHLKTFARWSGAERIQLLQSSPANLPQILGLSE